jgi:agmatine deiminase
MRTTEGRRHPERVATALGLARIVPEHGGRRVVLEGGAIDVNGCGTILATEECLLDPHIQVRNPASRRAEYGEVFARWLGAPNVIWLGRGVRGDEDTHGHVDDVCRFVNPTRSCWPRSRTGPTKTTGSSRKTGNGWRMRGWENGAR